MRKPRELTHDQIAERAYALWEQRGRPEGMSEEIWRTAENELRESEEISETNPGQNTSGDSADFEHSIGVVPSNYDRSLPPADRGRARAARRDEAPPAPDRSVPREHYVAVLDRAHLLLFRDEQPPGQSPRMRPVGSWKFPFHQDNYSSGDTDQAGRFPGSHGTSPGGSIDERLPMQNEQDRRAAESIAAQLNRALQIRPGATWDFAAGPALHDSVLGHLDPSVRQRMRRSVTKNLVRQPVADLRSYFPS